MTIWTRAARTASVVLLGAGGLLVVTGPSSSAATTVSLPAIVRDFEHAPNVNAPAAHPDFEDAIADDPGIVQATLGADRKPVYGNHPAGTVTTHGQAAFDQWFRDSPVGRTVPITLSATEDAGRLQFSDDNFYPVDGKGWNDPSAFPGGAQNEVGDDGLQHNFGFTVEIHATFTYQAGDTFTFAADDDVWVFLNNHLVVDLGGVHPSVSTVISLDGAIATAAGMTPGNSYAFDLFHAERHTTGSSFSFDTSLDLRDPAAPPASSSSSTPSTATSLPSATTASTAAAGAGGDSTSTTRRTQLPVMGGPEQTTASTGLVCIGLGLLALGVAERRRLRS